MFYVMREEMLTILPAPLDAFLVQHVDIVVQWRARAFVVTYLLIGAAGNKTNGAAGETLDRRSSFCELERRSRSRILRGRPR
jgi:hypothetical protein